MNEYYSYCPRCGESLTYSYCRCIRENPKTVDVTENWGKLMADLDRTRKELDLNKKLLARQCDLAREAETEIEALKSNRCDECGTKLSSYPSGCPLCGAPVCCQSCCKIDHYSKELDALRGKVQRFKGVIDSLGGIATLNIDLLEAYNSLCDVSQIGNSVDSNERPDPGMNMYYKNRTIANTEKVSTESVTQPKIDFCYACGTALGCMD